MTHHQIVIVGAGAAGISVAARLLNERPGLDIAIVDPAETHYYQPIWTLVGAGVYSKEFSAKPNAEFIPSDATWIKESVSGFDPDSNSLSTKEDTKIGYDLLVVAPGIQLNWSKVKGLKDALGKNGVASNYSIKYVEKTWEFLQGTKSGNAIFTFPATPIKCAGAPQKIMWLAEHHFRRVGVRKDVEVHYGSATAGIFGIPKYAKPLSKMVEERDIKAHFSHDLVEVRPASKEAVFRHIETDKELVLDYNFLHVTPPQSAPDFVSTSPLANADGWVDVDKYTTQHNTYRNVFSLGDASSLPCSKTGAAIRKEAPVTTANILSYLDGEALTARYNGYASCPLVTGYGKVMLAEFGYDGEIMETFPFDQAKERFSMWALKAYALPDLYWHGMLRGRL